MAAFERLASLAESSGAADAHGEMLHASGAVTPTVMAFATALTQSASALAGPADSGVEPVIHVSGTRREAVVTRSGGITSVLVNDKRRR